ncbi:MAG: sulfatase [Bacteroidales bacterium]|nr:sulfatase [Bacteroidales bacterium]
MKTNNIVSLVFILVFFNACSEKHDRFNIVFFMVDDLGWSDLGCYGSTFYDTPNIDKLANQGIRFTDAYAACHVCSPTRASFLTGKYPASVNITDWLPGRKDFPFQKLKNAEINQHIPYLIRTLPEVLRTNGYHTAIIGKWHLGEDSLSAYRQGFDKQIPKWNKGWPNKGYYAPYGLEGLTAKSEKEYLTDRLTDEALKYIEYNKDTPFFLYLSHFAVHDPIEGREDLINKYELKLKDKGKSNVSPFILEGNPDHENSLTRQKLDSLVVGKSHSGFRVFKDNTVKIKQIQDNVEFAAMVESVDESLGRLVEKLDELNLTKKTIIFFYSDNGGMAAANFYNPERSIKAKELDLAFSTSNIPLRGAKGWLYEGGIRVPLIIKWPETGKRGAICSVPVTTPDFYPTILDILNIDYDTNKLEGISISNLLKGHKTLEARPIYWHFPHYSNHGMQSPGGAIRYGDYKLIEYYENGTLQLFNLKDDIGEQNDLAELKPEKARELSSMLHKWLKDVNAQMMPPNPDYSPDK